MWQEWSKNISTPSQWLEEWLFADTVKGSLVADPSIQVPGFDLPRRLWCTLNRFRTGQGRCAASLTQGRLMSTSCNEPTNFVGSLQLVLIKRPWVRCTTTNDDAYFVEDCPVTRFPSGLPALHLADENALIWLDTQSKR